MRTCIDVFIKMYAWGPFPKFMRLGDKYKLTGVYCEVNGEFLIEVKRTGIISKFFKPKLIHEDDFIFREARRFVCRDFA